MGFFNARNEFCDILYKHSFYQVNQILDFADPLLWPEPNKQNTDKEYVYFTYKQEQFTLPRVSL